CNYSLVKIDEIANLGAARIRIRSILEFGQTEVQATAIKKPHRESTDLKKLIVPWFSKLYSPLLPPLFEGLGIDASVLPPQDQRSTDIGLEFVHNDMCYPAIVLIG